MRGLQAFSSFRLARGAEKELVTGGILPILALASAIIWPGPATYILAGLMIALFGLLLYFFRDPRRISPEGDDLVLAPADGRVVDVRRVQEPQFLEGEGLKISIFMSLFDVHVNRAPVAGKVTSVQHFPGQFLQAFRPEASDVNEHNLVGLEGRHGQVLIKQIAGILARRVVCWVRPGQDLQAGDRLGVIKFGSRVDSYLPLGVEPKVQVGDQTRAGVTVIGRWIGENNI